MFSGPLAVKKEEEKCNYLLIWCDEKGQDIANTWSDITDEDKKKLKTYFERFANHVEPKCNQVFSHYKFHKRVQAESETVEQFVTDLKLLVRDCSFKEPDEMIRDRIVFGTNSRKIREKLINKGKEWSLDKAVDIARTYEMSQSQMKSMKVMNPYTVSIEISDPGKILQGHLQTTAPMRSLLKKDSGFVWDYAQQTAFDKMKLLITSAGTLAYYDVKKEVTLQVDASKHGLGAVLMQEGKPVAYPSKSLSPAEQDYSQIEKEMYAIVFGKERFHQYIYTRHGIPEKLVSDNGPQFSAQEFAHFANEWDFSHITSSPSYPQSNGLVEKSVHIAKQLLKKSKSDSRDPYLGILEHRNTPLDNLAASAQLLMSRSLRSKLPTTSNHLKPNVVDPELAIKARYHKGIRYRIVIRFVLSR